MGGEAEDLGVVDGRHCVGVCNSRSWRGMYVSLEELKYYRVES